MTPHDNEFAESDERWRNCIEIAPQKSLAGDILVLADEAPAQALWLEAKRAAGTCLVELKHFDLAIEQFDAALAVAPNDKPSREQRAICFDRLGRQEEARVAARSLTRDDPTDAEAWALAGRIEKAHWIARWCVAGLTPAQMREAAAGEIASLGEAIAPYRNAFIADPSDAASGVDLLMLHLLLRHLGGEPDATRVDKLAGGVRWAARAAQNRAQKDNRARANLAELTVLVDPLPAVQREYGAAVAAANGDRFALDSTRQTLVLLRDLEFRPAETAAALAIVDAEIARSPAPAAPRQVLLFSGHMVDAPDRKTPRFPPEKVPQAAAAIAAALDALHAGPGDLALTQGAAGGDLLFAEACADRGVRVQLLLPLAEPAFIERSVVRSAGGDAWRARFFALKARLADAPRVLPDELGPPPRQGDTFERCNLWLLYTALACGQEKVRFVCLWDGDRGDGRGGTAHMVDEIKRRTGQVTWLDMRRL